MTKVFSSGQVDRGREVHKTNCTSCHGPEGYTGEGFAKLWKGRTLFDIFDQLKQTMPEDNPGKLSIQEYVDVIVYILNLNGFPVGETDLPADAEQLKLVKVDSIPTKPADK